MEDRLSLVDKDSEEMLGVVGGEEVLMEPSLPTIKEVAGEEETFEEAVIRVNRVSKVVKGGKHFRFSALVVVGNKAGRVGVGKGKAQGVPEAIKKAVENAKKNLIEVPIVEGGTIPHLVNMKCGAARVILKPASPGTGVIAGGAVRAVVELAGIKNILTKSLGSPNPINNARATIAALKSLRTKAMVEKLRSK